jgi:hypothetical protein
MKIVVIGGTGLIGSKAVAILRQGGHEVLAGSPKSGINSITGEGLKEAMAGAQAVIDLTNSPSFEDKAVLEFFETSGATFSSRRPQRASGTTSRSPSSESTGRTMAIAHRGGRCCSYRRRGGAHRTAKRHRRDRRPGTSAVQRNRRPLSEGGRRPA